MLPHPKPYPTNAQPWAANRGQPNVGLLFQRFFNGYEADTFELEKPRKDAPGGKETFAANLIEVWSPGATQRQAQCLAYASRIAALANQQTRAVLGSAHAAPAARPFVAQGRWLTGTGNAHPMEVGLSFHHTLGVPYLCGAGVKGLVNAWYTYASDEGATEEGLASYRRLFGSQAQAGELVFFDAVPATDLKLEKDVMTPHYGGWYEWDEANARDLNSGKAVPADWHSPVPVPFMAVARGMQLQFAIAPALRSKAADPARIAQDLATAWAWLEGALYWYGAGAKTAAGYGRFVAQGQGA